MIESITSILNNNDYWEIFDAFATLLSVLIITIGAMKLFHWWNKIKFFFHNFLTQNTIIVIGLSTENRSYIESIINWEFDGQSNI